MPDSKRNDPWSKLMLASLAGDEGAYTALLGDIASKLRGTIRGLLARSRQGNADIEDIVQETLLAIHLKKHTWDTGLPLTPWVNSIARHKMIDALRRKGVRMDVPIEDMQDTLPAEPSAPEGRMDAERLIEKLSPRQQHIVRAISFEGQSAADVAGELGMTEVSVRVALHRALKELAALFRDGASEN